MRTALAEELRAAVEHLAFPGTQHLRDLAAGLAPAALARLHQLGDAGPAAAVRAVLAGNICRPHPAAAGARLDDLIPMPAATAGVDPAAIGLTGRQAQVLALMVRGLSNREIAEHMALSEGTVKIHVTAVFKALGVSSRTQALVAAARYPVDFARVL